MEDIFEVYKCLGEKPTLKRKNSFSFLLMELELNLPFFLSNLIPLLEKSDVNGNIVNTIGIVTRQIWKILLTSVLLQKVKKLC